MSELESKDSDLGLFQVTMDSPWHDRIGPNHHIHQKNDYMVPGKESKNDCPMLIRKNSKKMQVVSMSTKNSPSSKNMLVDVELKQQHNEKVLESDDLLGDGLLLQCKDMPIRTIFECKVDGWDQEQDMKNCKEQYSIAKVLLDYAAKLENELAREKERNLDAFEAANNNKKGSCEKCQQEEKLKDKSDYRRKCFELEVELETVRFELNSADRKLDQVLEERKALVSTNAELAKDLDRLRQLCDDACFDRDQLYLLSKQLKDRVEELIDCITRLQLSKIGEVAAKKARHRFGIDQDELEESMLDAMIDINQGSQNPFAPPPPLALQRTNSSHSLHSLSSHGTHRFGDHTIDSMREENEMLRDQLEELRMTHTASNTNNMIALQQLQNENDFLQQKLEEAEIDKENLWRELSELRRIRSPEASPSMKNCLSLFDELASTNLEIQRNQQQQQQQHHPQEQKQRIDNLANCHGPPLLDIEETWQLLPNTKTTMEPNHITISYELSYFDMRLGTFEADSDTESEDLPVLVSRRDFAARLEDIEYPVIAVPKIPTVDQIAEFRMKFETFEQHGYVFFMEGPPPLEPRRPGPRYAIRSPSSFLHLYWV